MGTNRSPRCTLAESAPQNSPIGVTVTQRRALQPARRPLKRKAKRREFILKIEPPSRWTEDTAQGAAEVSGTPSRRIRAAAPALLATALSPVALTMALTMATL